MVFIASLLVALALSASFSPVSAVRRGLAWATDNNFAKNIANNPRISWYHHWQDGPVSQMPGDVEFVPMFWGPKYWNLWNQRVGQMRQKTPKHLMAFNEPDVGGQSNMNAYYAAELYMEQIQPWSKKGTLLGSPAIVWDLNWLATFLSEVHKKGGHVDFICLHWYGSWQNLSGLKRYVETAHARFGKPIWITEIGITTSSWPSQTQVKSFMMNAVSWMEDQPYIYRVAWFGCFESNNPPDNFATGKNALLKPGGWLNDKGFWYGFTERPDKRSISARHHVLSREDLDDDVPTSPPVHCDEICQKRTAQIAEWEQQASATLESPPSNSST